jgi:hypothetical protein
VVLHPGSTKDRKEHQSGVVLGGGTVSGRGLFVTVQVNYRFEGQSPASAARYVWVVQSPRGVVYERTFTAAQLGPAGTLRESIMSRPFDRAGPLTTYLAVEGVVDGKPGGRQRERVSNVATLTPDPAAGFPRGWRLP